MQKYSKKFFFSLKVIKMVLRGAIGNHMSLIIVGRASVEAASILKTNKHDKRQDFNILDSLASFYTGSFVVVIEGYIC